MLLFHSRGQYAFAHSWSHPSKMWLLWSIETHSVPTPVLAATGLLLSRMLLWQRDVQSQQLLGVRLQQLLDVPPQQPRDVRPQQPRDVRPQQPRDAQPQQPRDVHCRRS